MVSAGLLLEHNDAYSSNRYGTPVSGVLEAISKGAIPCLEIDQNGLSQLLTEGKAEPHQIRSVFITATASGLNKRLHKRNTESEPAIRRRLMNSLDETQNLHLYSAIVNNRDDDLESTVEKVMHAFEGRPRSDTFDAVVFRNEMEQILKNGST